MTSVSMTKRSSSPSPSHQANGSDGLLEKGRDDVKSKSKRGDDAPAAPSLAPPSRTRPPARSNFDLEPNPFEHSFSSNSNVSHDTPKNDSASGTMSSNFADTHDANATNQNANAPATPSGDSKPMLPPLAALESPADQGFGAWGLASSLRSGPLSPAMLAGPASNQAATLGLGAFDSSFVRTGLTPDVHRTGLTPLIGGPGGFPPPSPNTAALFALVNGSSSANNANVAITPGTLNAITGVLGGHNLGVLQQPSGMTIDMPGQHAVDGPQQQQNGQYHPHESYPHDSASHAITNAASALYLLSQQQNLQRHQNPAQGQVNPSAVSGNTQTQLESPTNSTNPTALGPTRRATKRKTTIEAPAPPPRKKTKSTGSVGTRGSSRRRMSKMDDMEDDDDEDEDDEEDDYIDSLMAPPALGANGRTGSTTSKSGGTKRPETEEEKRKNFLERNRQAALKCRQRKKAWLTALQQKVENLSAENDRLSKALVTSREEISRLSQMVVAHGGAPSTLLAEQSPISINGMQPDGSGGASERERGNSVSSAGTVHPQQTPVHVNLNLSMPNGNGMSHGHSHSLSQAQAQAQAQAGQRGHARSQSHGHNPLPASVTVGGRGYGY